MMDFVKLAAIAFMFERAHDNLTIRDPLEPWVGNSEMYFLTGGVPKDTERTNGTSTTRVRLSMHTQSGDVGKLPPTTDNIIKVLTEKEDDVKCGRKTNTAAWNEFTQVIPVDLTEKDRQVGPDHHPLFVHTLKTSCDNRYWKDVKARGEGLTKKVARENACSMVFGILFDIYLVKLRKGRLTPPPPVDSDSSDDEPQRKVEEKWYVPAEHTDKILDDIANKKYKQPSVTPKYQHEPDVDSHVKVLRAMKMVGDAGVGRVIEDFAIGGPIEAQFIEANIGINIVVRRERSVLLNQSLWKVVLEVNRGMYNGQVDSSTYTIPYHGKMTTASLDTLVRSAFTSFFFRL